MRRKDRDMLIQMAFDEANSNSGEQLSQAEQAEYAHLKQIKADMNLLRAVPECQLSIESVRDAILGSEIKAPRHRLASLVWVAPLCAGLLVFGIFNLNRSGVGDSPTSIQVGSAHQGSLAANSAFDIESFLPNSIVSSVDFAAEQMPTTDVSTEKRATVATLAVSRRTALHNSSRSLSNPRFEAMAARAVESGSAIHTESASSHPTVVIINPDVNGDTGAKTANEVETGSNVVIGG